MSKLYLAGSITGLLDKFEECEIWRHDVKELFEEISKWKVFNPVEHLEWDYTSKVPKLCEGKDGGMSFDLYNLRHSDVVMVDLRFPSIGTNMELGIAYELKIPIIGFIDKSINKEEIHPWIKNCCLEICDDLDDAKLYFVDHFINED